MAALDLDGDRCRHETHCSWMVGNRDALGSTRVHAGFGWSPRNRVQLTTDGHKVYLEAVDEAFGVGYRLRDAHETLRRRQEGDTRYSPAACIGATARNDHGQPSQQAHQHELRGAPEPHDADAHAPVYSADEWLFKEAREPHRAISLHFMYYNFVRIHQSLRVTPAMAAGVTDRVWESPIS